MLMALSYAYYLKYTAWNDMLYTYAKQQIPVYRTGEFAFAICNLGT